MKHIAIYVRVSTKQQDTASQEPDLKRWIAAYADGVDVKWYRDKFTGKTMNRPGWNALEADLQAGKISKVVVWRIDRLGRLAKGLTALFSDLTERKVGLVSLKDGVDLGTPAGRMMANVIAAIAQFETEIRAERVLAGQAEARENGVTWGGSEKGRRIKVNDDQLAMILRMGGEGAKITAIARATGLSRPTVYAHLPAKV